MRELISSIFVLLCLSVHAENTYFSSFLSKLVFTSKTCVTDSTFGMPQIGDMLDKNAFGRYLPILADDCNCDEDEILWRGGSYMKKGNYIVAFMQRFNTDCKDGNEKWFMEHIIGDYVMVVYSKAGVISDSKIIGKSSSIHFAHISGDITSDIVVDQGLLTDMSRLHTYDPLEYVVSKHSFSVNASGKIEEKVSQPWTELKEQKQEDSSEDTTFSNYLKYFERWDKSLVDDSVYMNNVLSEIPHSLVTAFLFSLQECDCWAKDIVWSACKYIEKERYYILFVLRGCDFPKKDEPLYTEKIILTYDNAGKCIDYCVLGKVSDDESVSISSGSNSQRIILDKGMAVRAEEYTIDIEGNIHSSTSNLKEDCIYASTPDEGKEFVEKFYVEYLSVLTRETTETLRDNMLTSDFRKQLEEQEALEDADLILRGQDANEESAKTVKVTPNINRWYVVSYLDIYSNIREEIPVHLTEVAGKTKIDSIVFEGKSIPKAAKSNVKVNYNKAKDMDLLTTFFEKYLYQVATDEKANCRYSYLTNDLHSRIQKSSMSENRQSELVCGIAQASATASSTVSVTHLQDMDYLVTFISDGKEYNIKVHLTSANGKLAIDAIDIVKP